MPDRGPWAVDSALPLPTTEVSSTPVQEIKDRIAGIDSQIELLEHQIEALRGQRATLVQAQSILDGQTTLFEAFPELTPLPANASIGDAASEILRRAGHPLHADSIIRRLESLGRSVGKKSLVATLKALPSRFKSLKGNYYELIESD